MITNPADRTELGNGLGSGQCGLLISVSNSTEAAIVAQHPVTVVDIKDPGAGSLGRPRCGVVERVLNEIPDNQFVSVALGEFLELEPGQLTEYFANCDPTCNREGRIRFAKIGLSQALLTRNWQQRWARLLQEFPTHVCPVAVGYFDEAKAKSPPIEEVIQVGAELGCEAILLDTYCKTNGGLFSYVQLGQIREYREMAKALGLHFVLAGSVSKNDLPLLGAVKPDLIGARGAVCCGANRNSKIDDERLGSFVDAMRLHFCSSS